MNIAASPLITPEQMDALRRQLISRSANKSGHELVRAEVAVEPRDILSWLFAQEATEKMYWRNPGGDLESAGIGAVDIIKATGPVDAKSVFRKIEATLSSVAVDARYYGGFRFDMGADGALREDHWKQFGSARFVLPQVELMRRGRETTLAVQCRPDDIVTTLRQAQGEVFAQSGRSTQGDEATQGDVATRDDRDEDAFSKPLPRVVLRRDWPEKSGWNDGVRQTLSRIRSGVIRKLVLARRVTLTTDSLVPVLVLLRNQSISDNQTTLFAFAPGDRTVFIGATPELLYQRVGRAIWSEAIAGTRVRGTGPADDARLADELRHSKKDLVEVELVRDGIRQALGPRCESLKIDNAPQAIRTMSVQHLKFGIQGVLCEGVDDAELLMALSPTPAVGGWPKEGAARLIAELEPFDRGWYAGPVGWVSREGAAFAVAIRSALVRGNEVDLYSGAGIVAGSDPDSEWRELETKIGPYVRMFGL
jgi:menaquinone-specific isochorismate synthase